MAEVSVVIPTFNRADTVYRAIESALNQSHRPSEIVVVDDGSTDETEAMLSSRFGDHIRYIKQENAGVAAARNAGIHHAKGSLVAFLDSDDTWEPNKLELQVPTIMENGVVLSATNWRWEDDAESNKFRAIGVDDETSYSVVDYPLARLSSPKGHGILIQSCIFRRKTLLRLGGFDRSFRITEDNDLIFRMATAGKLAILSDVLLLRNRSDAVDHLTVVSSLDWRRENLDNMLLILSRAIQDAVAYPPDKRRLVTNRYAQLLLDRAKLSAQIGEYGDARHYARTALRYSSKSLKNLIRGLALVAYPQARSQSG